MGMADDKGPTVELCDWACSTRYSDLPAEVCKEAVTILYDTIGGMIASSTLPTCLPVVEMVKAIGGNGDCSIVGHPVKTTVTHAALANGTIGHGDEVDAVGKYGGSHFAAVTVPTGISLGQYVRASGKELLRAVALGSEVAARINMLQVEVFDHRRRHFSRTIGSTMGAAVLASLLLNLNAEQMEHALGLAASEAAGLSTIYSDPAHQCKSLQMGIAAQGGIIAALLAQRGFHGPPEVLTTEHGFFEAFTGYAGLGNRVVDDLGKTYLINRIQYKLFPVGGPNQFPLYVFLQMLKKHKLTADDIANVEVMITIDSFLTAATLKHPSVYQPTVLSLAAVFGEVGFQHIHDPRYYQDARVEAFKERVKLLPQRTQDTAASSRQMQLRIRTHNGEVMSEALPSGFPSMNEEKLQRKFRTLVGLRANEKKVLDLERKLKGIGEVNNIAPLISELELPG
ncbi:MmgE/PrpD family protein [Chloroflexota bacterium]